MLTYAGIGSRQISPKEKDIILKISSFLSKRYILFSGNATGSDVSFQQGSNNKCIIFLPYKTFNIKEYNPFINSLNCYVLGNGQEGTEFMKKHHPGFENWKEIVKPYIVRDYYQIKGYKDYPSVSFVLFCASEIDGKIEGGTRHAVGISRSLNIPTFNIRSNPNWLNDLKSFIEHQQSMESLFK